MSAPQISSLLLLSVLLILAGCPEPSTRGPSAAPDEADDILAVVNGAPITEGDVAYWLRGSHGQAITPDMKSSTLNRLIETEIIYQKGRELGLHRDSAYQRKVRGLELSLRATQRSEMMRRVYNMEIAAKIEVDAQETRAYYDANKERISRSLHLGTIQFESREEAAEALRMLGEGVSFEALADRAGEQGEPRYGWDLGPKHWASIPLEWHDVVYSLEAGEVSGVFRGKESGVALFKLYGTTVDPETHFELVASVISDRIKNISDPRAYYEAHEERIKRTLHLGMIPFPNEAMAEAALEKLRQGLTFDELAAALQSEGKHAKSQRSWDLGSLPWARIPQEWHDVVYSLEPGEVSSLLAGEQTGIRLFKLFDSTQEQEVEFKTVRNSIMNRLKEAKVRESYKQYLAALRANARIERTPDL